jgi:hypothetical protein
VNISEKVNKQGRNAITRVDMLDVAGYRRKQIDKNGMRGQRCTSGVKRGRKAENTSGDDGGVNGPAEM